MKGNKLVNTLYVYNVFCIGLLYVLRSLVVNL